METLTIAKIGEPKTINYTNKKTGRPDSFQKVGFQTNENPGQWYDFTFRGACSLQVGQKYEFEVTPRDYNGKTYYDAKLPKRAPQGGGMSDEQFQRLMTGLNTINTNVLRVLGRFPEPKPTIPGTKVEYPNEEVFENPFGE